MQQTIIFTDTSRQIQAPLPDDEWDPYFNGDYTVAFPGFMSMRPWNYVDVQPELLNTDNWAVFTAVPKAQPFGSVEIGDWENLLGEMSTFFTEMTIPELNNDPELFRGRAPFFNLFTQWSTEGHITASGVRMLAADFRTAQKTEHLMEMTYETIFLLSLKGKLIPAPGAPVGEHLAEMYCQLRESVYATARSGGMMIFKE